MTKRRISRYLRRELFREFGGKCFYCGNPVIENGHEHPRDWLIPDIGAGVMAREHCIPSSRGGDSSPGNSVPACAKCNQQKGQFTREEYRFLRGLQSRMFPYRFFGEPQRVAKRDWLICCAANYEQSLLLHNIPAAKDGVPRVRPLSFGRKGQP